MCVIGVRRRDVRGLLSMATATDCGPDDGTNDQIKGVSKSNGLLKWREKAKAKTASASGHPRRWMARMRMQWGVVGKKEGLERVAVNCLKGGEL